MPRSRCCVGCGYCERLDCVGGLAFMIGVGVGLVVDMLVGLPDREYHGAVAADVIQCNIYLLFIVYW